MQQISKLKTSNFFLNFFFKILILFLNFYNGIVFYIIFFSVSFFIKAGYPSISNKIWIYGFKLYCTNYTIFALRILFSLQIIFIFCTYLFLMILFSFIVYTFILSLVEYCFGYFLFACNKAFLFFLINLFFYYFLYDDQFLNFTNFENINSDDSNFADTYEDGEWRYLGMDLDEESDEEEDHFEIENREIDTDLGVELNDYDGYHLDFLSVDSFDDINFNSDGDFYLDDIYYIELLDNLSFFDKWLGLSNNVVINMYGNLEINNLRDKLLTPTTFNDFNHLVNTEFVTSCTFFNSNLKSSGLFKEISNLSDLLCNHLVLLDNVLLSDSIWFQLQLTDPRFLKKNKIFIRAAKQKPELYGVQGFKNKYSIRHVNKLSLLRYGKLNKAFYTRFFYDKNLRLHNKIRYKNFSGISALEILSKIRLDNYDIFSDLFFFKWLNESLNFTKLGNFFDKDAKFFNVTFIDLYNKVGSIKGDVKEKETLLQKYKLRFSDFQFNFLRDEKDDLKDLQGIEINSFFEQFFKLVLQENFDEDDSRFFNETDISATLNIIDFFFSFIIVMFPLTLQIIILELFYKFLKLNYLKGSVGKRLLSLLNLVESQRKESILILLIFFWKETETDFLDIRKNIKFYKIFRKFISSNNFEYLFRDLFYSYNSFDDYNNDILMDEQKTIRREFRENFEVESRFLNLLNPMFRTFHLTTKYNERSLTWKLGGKYEFFLYIPLQYLNSFINETNLKRFYFEKKNPREIYFKKIKILSKYTTVRREFFFSRMKKYFLFHFTKFLFFFFSKKYWLLRFIPFLFDFANFYGYGGTLIEFNQNIYSNVIRRFYNFGITEPKYKVDFVNLVNPHNYWDRFSRINNPLIIDTKSYFPDVVNVNLNCNILLKLNILYNSSLELELIYFLLFIRRNIFFRSGFKNFFKLLNSNYWLSSKSGIRENLNFVRTNYIGNFLFYDFCENIYFSKFSFPAVGLKVQKYRKILATLYYYKSNKCYYKKKFFSKKVLKKKHKIKSKGFDLLLNLNLKNYDVEILGLFLNKFWLNDYYDTYHSSFNFNNDPLWEDGTGGGVLINDESPFDSFLNYMSLWDGIWDWHVLNWEIVLHLFYDLDRLYLKDEVEFFEKEDGHFFSLMVIAVFLWFYCRFFKFLYFNDSPLKERILNFVEYDATTSMFRFFFENFVQSTGRNRLLGKNYVGKRRSWFNPPFSIGSYQMLYEFPMVTSLKEYKSAIKDVRTSKFTLDRFRLINTYRDDLYQSTSLKFFDTTADLYKLRRRTLAWLLHSNLKTICLNDNVLTSTQSIDLSLLRDFLHWSRYFKLSSKKSQYQYKKRKNWKKRVLDTKSRSLTRLWDRFFLKLFNFPAYSPSFSSSSDMFEKLIEQEYRNYIIRSARRRRMDNYSYEVLYGTEDMASFELAQFEKLQYSGEIYAAFETKGKSYLSEFMFFNMLRAVFKDKKSGKKVFKDRNSNILLNGFYGSILKNNIQYRSEVRSTFNDTLHRLPKLVNFIFSVKGERRSDFLNTANLSHFIFRLLSEFTGEDFIAFNQKYARETINSDFDNFNRFSNWFETLYFNPYTFRKPGQYILLNQKGGIKRLFFRTIDSKLFDKIFLSYYDLSRSLEWFLYSQNTDFKYIFTPRIHLKNVKETPFSGNLSTERGLHLLKTVNYFLKSEQTYIDIQRFFYLEFARRFINRPYSYSLSEFFSFDFQRKLRYRKKLFKKLKQKSTKRNRFRRLGYFWPYYRFHYFKLSLFESLSNILFISRSGLKNNYTQFLNNNNNNNNKLVSDSNTKYRKFRASSYKDYYMEGLFNLGRQYVDFNETENGFNRQFDLKLGLYGGDFYEPLFNFGSHSRQHQWYLGDDDLFNESIRRVYHVPSWLWSYILRRHLGYNRFDMPRYTVYQGFSPGFYPTGKIVSKGHAFYGSRFFELMPDNYTFEDVQFPAEEGYVGINLVPTFTKFLVMCFMPFNYIFNYLQNKELFLDSFASYSYYGDNTKRPRWLVNYLNLNNKELFNVGNNLYETHTGISKPAYFKLRGMVPSDYFINRDSNILLFRVFDSIYKNLFFKYDVNTDLKKFQGNTIIQKNSDLFEAYFPLKILFPNRTFFFSFFSVSFVILIIYLFIYYFIWIPLHYLIYSLNHTFDGTFSREDELMMEDEINLLIRDLYKDFYILPSNFPLLKNNFDDFYNRSFFIYPEVNVFDYLTQHSNYLEHDIMYASYEAPQFDNFTDHKILFYGSILHQFLRNEIFELFLIRLHDQQNLSFNLLDIISFSNHLFYYDEMKSPHPNYRAFYNEFLNILVGHEINSVDFLEEYVNNLQGVNNKKFYNLNRTARNFIKKVNSKKYFGDGIYIKKFSKKKKLVKTNRKYNSKITLESRTNFLNNLVCKELLDDSINKSLRQIVWSSVLFVKESLKILNIRDSLFLNTDILYMSLFNETINVNFLYFSEILTFLPKGSWGFMKNSFVDCIFFSQYKTGESFLPFYYRFNRIDSFDFSYLKNSNEIYNSRFFDLNLESISSLTKSKLQGYNSFFDVKDIGFVHSIHNENISSEISLSLISNFKVYLEQTVFPGDYIFTDLYAFNEYTKEIFNYYSNEYIEYLLNNDFDADDWELILEENRDWFMAYPTFGNLKIELTYEMNPLIFEFEYYKDSSIDLKSRIIRTIPLFNYYGIRYSYLRKYAYTYLSNIGIKGLYDKIPLARSIVYDALQEDRLDADVEMKSILVPDDSDYFHEELEFPDHYTKFSNYYNKYSTDFFIGGNSLLLSCLYSPGFVGRDNSIFLHLYLLQFFSHVSIVDINQRFDNSNNNLDLKFEILSSNQHNFYLYVFFNEYFSLLRVESFERSASLKPKVQSRVYFRIKQKFFYYLKQGVFFFILLFLLFLLFN